MSMGSPLTPFMMQNPYYNNQTSNGFGPQQPAAYSQMIGPQLASFGMPLPIQTYPNWNPLGSFLGGGATAPVFQGLGFG